MTRYSADGCTQAPINELTLSCLSSRKRRISFITSREMSFLREKFNSFIRTTTPLYWAVVANTCKPPRDSYDVTLALAKLSWKIKNIFANNNNNLLFIPISYHQRKGMSKNTEWNFWTFLKSETYWPETTSKNGEKYSVWTGCTVLDTFVNYYWR